MKYLYQKGQLHVRSVPLIDCAQLFIGLTYAWTRQPPFGTKPNTTISNILPTLDMSQYNTIF